MLNKLKNQYTKLTACGQINIALYDNFNTFISIFILLTLS